MDLYREEILEHWQNPLNFGELKGANKVIDQINPLCGDQITLFFKLLPPSSSSRKRGSGFSKRELIFDKSKSKSRMTKGNGSLLVKDVRFTGNGCAISIASASMVSEFIKGKKVSDLAKIEGKDVLKLIGGPVGPARLKCAFLALEAIKKLPKEVIL